VFEMGGAAAESGGGYPAWKPNLASQILHLTRATYATLNGKEPEVKAIHAGLECGSSGEVSGDGHGKLWPTLTGVHTPDERSTSVRWSASGRSSRPSSATWIDRATNYTKNACHELHDFTNFRGSGRRELRLVRHPAKLVRKAGHELHEFTDFKNEGGRGSDCGCIPPGW